MPIIKSAIKRVRQEARRQQRNTGVKNKYKQLIKDINDLIAHGKMSEAATLFPQVQKAIDMASKKNLMHKNTAARKKSSLARQLKDAPAAKKTTTAKPAAKKAPAKKAPAAKKAAPKKT